MRVGLGYDVHRLEEGRKLIVGGVMVNEGIGAVAHSDGDVLCHALMDALLGATGMGDIGEMFPEVEENRGMNSLEALSKVVEVVREKGFEILSADSVVVLSGVRLSRFRKPILDKLESVLGCPVSVKFKSGNGVGEVGEGRAIEAFAVVLVRR